MKDKEKTVVFITGATGVMGFETLKEFCRHNDEFEVRILARPSKKNKRLLNPFLKSHKITVVWGDLMVFDDVKAAMGEAEYVLHLGGMVSPLADHFPEKTLKVNIGATNNIVQAIKSRKDKDRVKLVYIGSVAQTSHRFKPHHWGRTGDPVMAGVFDYYGISKIKAERIVAESGLKYWVSLRQSGILHKGLIFKGSDPISFHVPLQGVLEWATVEDSARLMTGVCRNNVPESFWRKFYNIGSGKEFRLTVYEFEKLLMKSLGCPAPEKCFETSWFATRNFHGEWFTDSDLLNEIIPFRESITAEAYFKRMAKSMPWYMSLTPLAPALIIKAAMRHVARTPGMGPLDWLRRSDCEERITAFFGSREEIQAIPDWSHFDLSRPSDKAVLLSHGYDESKPDSELDISDMKSAAEFRGGKCLSASMAKGDIDTPLEWECSFGHRFKLPRTVLKGGHWCPDCLPTPWKYDEEARKNPFLAQVSLDSHSPEEDEIYG